MSAEPPDIAVAVASHARPLRLRWLLEARAEQTLDRSRWELVVAHDSGPDSETERLLREHPAADRHLTFTGTRGPAELRNAAWRATSAPAVAFTDDDCRPPADWLERALAAARPDAIVQGATRPDPDEAALLRAPHPRTVTIDPPTASAQTCNIAYPRAVLERLGGFDESFRGPQGEDVDLGWRARAAGVTPVFAPDAEVQHAVMELGPAATLRRAWRWSPAMRPFADHDALRRERLHQGLFWNWTHYLLLRALLALPFLRRRATWPVAAWLGGRLVAYEVGKGRAQGRRSLALFWLVHDVVETAAVLRGAVRYRTLVI